MSAYEKLYEGKAKIVYQTDDPDVLLVCFKDDATAFNAQKRGQIVGKGEMNCKISTRLFQLLQAAGMPTHFIDSPAAAQMRVWRVDIVPIEAIVRNIAAGSLCRQTGLPLGKVLPRPLVEFCYKNDALGDPLLTRDRLQMLELAAPEQIQTMENYCLQINEILGDFFNECGITLVDFKLEFGIVPPTAGPTSPFAAGTLLLADEISPDTCRLWQQSEDDPQKRVLDKDRFRQNLPDVEAAYQQVLDRVTGH
ncbi:phosphoribosylaminoimidazolesuccinocarboxamide synthase [Geitlerinema sp. PCC 9228]|jgi:phosphoribosylaminoimidazole-succinocarboxamide synthase|uniref:phosphoribosylaminoimidazolesuccinocarboxamide synthase n=1 Tax=Geitlerinema sp. PCC 9228 TaxID=111611 RepID=UPI0008F9C60D|nr:phosphoribosylaminoimidazolesuccinocarboxamide synthase [Geitlerinema sp. PCC 9228]